MCHLLALFKFDELLTHNCKLLHTSSVNLVYLILAAVEFLRSAPEGKYDAIIVDSSDPVGMSFHCIMIHVIHSVRHAYYWKLHSVRHAYYWKLMQNAREWKQMSIVVYEKLWYV